MEYFDDLSIIAVSKMITTRNGKPARCPYGAIGLMLRGPAILCREDFRRELPSPFLYWSHPDEAGAWETPPGAIRENLWIAAEGPRFERMLDALDKLSPDRFAFLEKTGNLVSIFDRMRIRFERNTPADCRALPLLTEELMFEIREILQEEEVSGRMCSMIRETAKRMTEHPEKDFDVLSEARKHGISADYFRHCFQQYIGTSVHNFTLAQRYALAVRLLRETDRSIGDIGETCGFPIQGDFTRFFKNRGGVSPREFRKNVY